MWASHRSERRPRRRRLLPERERRRRSASSARPPTTGEYAVDRGAAMRAGRGRSQVRPCSASSGDRHTPYSSARLPPQVSPAAAPAQVLARSPALTRSRGAYRMPWRWMFVAQPAEQRREVAAGELRVEVAEVLAAPARRTGRRTGCRACRSGSSRSRRRTSGCPAGSRGRRPAA